VLMAKDAHRSRHIQCFSQCTQHFANALRGCIEAIEWGVAAGAEGGGTGLTAKGLDAFVPPVGAIADERVDLRSYDPIVDARVVGAGEALGADPLGRAPPAFDHRPRYQRGTRRRTGGRSCVLATGRTVIGGTRLQEALQVCRDRAGMGLLAAAQPDQPNRNDHQQQYPPRIGRHRRPRAMISG
jgi:hypothetical protein